MFRRSARYLFGATAVGTLGAALIVNRQLALESELHAKPAHVLEYYEKRSLASLCSSLVVYTVSSSPTLVALGKTTIKVCDALHVPALYEVLARRTFYAQFCGGENFDEVLKTMSTLRKDNIGVILSYTKEESASTEEGYDRVKENTFDAVDIAGSLPNNFVALKLTALGDPAAIRAHSISLRTSVTGSSSDAVDMNVMSEAHAREISKLKQRLFAIMDRCVEKKVKVLIDAEQDRYQASIDHLTLEASRQYNRHQAVAYGTYQCYLKRALRSLQQDLSKSEREGFYLGVKLVRGAYITSEPRELINDTKEETDSMYDASLELLIPASRAEVVVASHNSKSLQMTVDNMASSKSPMAVSQLYGMSSTLTYSLLKQIEQLPRTEIMERGGGIRVYCYVPWGTVEESMKYLLRRADENSSMVDRAKAERDEIASALYGRLRRRLLPS